MRANHVRGAVAVIAAVALLAACGGDETTAGATAGNTVPAASAASTERTAPAPTAVATTALVDEDCAMERNILSTSAQVYLERYGEFPASEAELVEADIIGEESEAYDLVPGTRDVVRVPGVPCPAPASEPPPTAPLTVDDVLAEMGEDGIAFIGGPECAREFAEIALAGERFIAREGRDPESIEDLADDLAVEPELWIYDSRSQTLAPSEGSPCVDVFGEDVLTECDAERKTLEVAVEAYVAQYGAPPASEDDLVGDFLRQPVERFDLDGSARVVATPGGPCDTVPTTSAP